MSLSLSQSPVSLPQSDFTIQQLLFSAKYQLSIVTDEPLLEAEILLAQVLKKNRGYLHAWPHHKLTYSQASEFLGYVGRRLKDEPIAYITGTREFWSLELSVNKDTLIPRPETELLVETALDMYEDKSEVKIADLGTGSGAVALALAHEKPDWKIHATDVSDKALQTAKTNSERLKLKNVSFYQGHWCMALPEKDFDMIISNPPYISETEWEVYSSTLTYEPKTALVSGSDGLDAIRTIVHTSKNYLKSSGYVLVEHGFLQGASVRKIFAAEEYTQIRTLRDLSGKERATLGRVL